ncbi:MAG: hypothetical protein Q4D38_07740 [Planctomycetia bacterium]|nr:hypothetical protein [Planctomycetia bacterium]
MKQPLIIVFLFVLIPFSNIVFANDWATTGKGGSGGTLSDAEIQKAWDDLPKWVAGTDAGALLAMDWIVIHATSDPAARKETARRLAELLDNPKTTPGARKFIFAKLYQVGTEAEVPLVAPWLEKPETTDDARLFLERLGTDAAKKAMRDAAAKLEGRPLVGIMNSLSILEDSDFLVPLSQYATQTNELSHAAWRALGNYGTDEAGRFFLRLLRAERRPNAPLEAAAIRCAVRLKERGSIFLAEAILDQMTFSFRSLPARQAGWSARWSTMSEKDQQALVPAWEKSIDPAQRLLAKKALASEILETDASKRTNADWLALLNSQNALEEKEALDYFLSLPKEVSGAFLLEELKKQAVPSRRVVETLARLKYYDAIDTLVVLARKPDPQVYEVAIHGLRGVCDPDEPDLRRMLKLYLDVREPRQKDLVSRAVAMIAEKNPDEEKRADILLAFILEDARRDEISFQAEVLPLLGRIGTSKVFEKIDVARKSDSPILQDAAWIALCNWPNADHADLLWERAQSGDSTALRAYIRVITIPTERAPEEVLIDLRKAFEKAKSLENRLLAISRASAVRSKETVAWVASFLNDEALSQQACATIVELAHHRFLRQPNREFFEPILKKVAEIATDKDVQARAEKARLGM